MNLLIYVILLILGLVMYNLSTKWWTLLIACFILSLAVEVRRYDSYNKGRDDARKEIYTSIFGESFTVIESIVMDDDEVRASVDSIMKWRLHDLNKQLNNLNND